MLTETLVDVDGYFLALYCRGAGTPTVVLDAGGGAGANSWERIQAAVAPMTQVCAFDRPGMGKSDPAPHPRTPHQLVDEVHLLLARAAIRPPYVLVGHSSGGLHMRLYATRYADEVAGVVLIDAVHPDQFRRAAALLPPEVPDEDAGLHAFRAALRTINQSHAETTTEGTPPDLGVGGSGCLGAIPLLVLTATQHDLGVPAAIAARLEQDWQAMQHELIGLSSNSVHIIAEGSGHNIHLEHPEVVVDAIRRVIQAAQRQVPLQDVS